MFWNASHARKAKFKSLHRDEKTQSALKEYIC
jgi:hypothetical protein